MLNKLKSQKDLLIPSLLIIISIICAVYLFTQEKPDDTKNNSQNTAIQNNSNNYDNSDNSFNLLNFTLIKPVFSQYSNNLETVTPSLPYASIKFDEIENLTSFTENEDINFSEEQIKALEEYGFFLTENNIIEDQSGYFNTDDFVDMYDEFNGDSIYDRKGNNAVFITSDLALHTYHILIDRSFQKIEETKFYPLLKEMTESLFMDSIQKYHESENEKLKQSYERLSSYYLIPLIIMDSVSENNEDLSPENFATYAQYLEAEEQAQQEKAEQDLTFSLNEKSYNGMELSDTIYETCQQELELISKAEGLTKSPLFTPLRPEFKNDYSQFKPRSHYTKNDILKSYFMAMMWYGRMGFTLNSDDLTRDALIITAQINNLQTAERKVSDIWSTMSAAIEFFVGEIDDLTAYQYTDVIKKVYGENFAEDNLKNDELLNQFIQTALAELPQPKILSEAILMPDYDAQTKQELLADTMQFRFMGQRFTPDAYVLNSLTQGDEAPDEETGQKLPTMPTALMPISVIAPQNNVVSAYLDAWINDPQRIANQGRESDKVIAKFLNQLNQEFSTYDEATWTQNIYWSWLDSFQPLLQDYGDGYPFFMQNENWQKKNLETVLGSYTELKHDTLLYAKQSYAEMGGGGSNNEIPLVVKGYVEPDLEFWNKILNLAKKTKQGLKEKNIFPEEFFYKYQSFIESVEFLRQIAIQELQNEKISDEDFEKLRTMDLEQIVSAIAGEELTDKEKRAGIIADIHTDAVNGQILYEATGKPYIIYVAVNDVNGTRLTRGAVYNHYEFADELDERLADEDWQDKVYLEESEMPDADEWSLELLR